MNLEVEITKLIIQLFVSKILILMWLTTFVNHCSTIFVGNGDDLEIQTEYEIVNKGNFCKFSIVFLTHLRKYYTVEKSCVAPDH